ncbi:MAG TPA: alpha/beta hydrolase [Candidatus Dormibacteraeota bacterium]|nr:alpha/beta hydrolase [Candidatus Dormibacteraeota bacterium]
MTSRGAVVLVLVTFLTAGCTLNPKPAATSSPTPSPSRLTWIDCGGGFQCATVQAPLDYSHPEAGTIGIAISRKPATEATRRIGSVLTNPGGPGASGIQFLRGEVAAMANLNTRFDLIGFDPRGIGQSAPVRCLDGPQEDVFNALDPVLDDPNEKQASIDADKNFAAGCTQRSASVLTFVDSVSAARDMDVIRVALGDQKLTFLGFSYGTFLGQNYAHLFPTRVRALALDGVIDPMLAPNDLLYAQLVGFEQNLQAFLNDCRAHKTAAPTCTYAQAGDPGTKLMDLMQRLDTTPLVVGSRSLTRGLAVIGVITPLYDPSTWPYLDQALALADRGNGTLLLRFSDLYLGRKADGTYDNQTDANTAVNCVDRPVPADVASYDALGPKFTSASALFGPAFQYSNLVCAYWQVKPKGKVGPITADNAPPILLVGGTGDPATPYVWAQAVNKVLSGSVLLTREGNGHVSYDKSACAKQAIDAYLIDLTLPPAGTVCR